ncbi:hypothetical protein QF037_003215 [Streptomyces canus]|uniref:hypothetical protein n=1 Tax=Streptomyces canus TaxID=58343 RepID=UPI00278B2DDD|nr:hypothetical protein [Streptomyces canus]MDQ0598870.1 hypothetical protein [Streptomyces canus]
MPTRGRKTSSTISGQRLVAQDTGTTLARAGRYAVLTHCTAVVEASRSWGRRTGARAGSRGLPARLLWSTAFTVLAALVALALPAQVAAPERPS